MVILPFGMTSLLALQLKLTNKYYKSNNTWRSKKDSRGKKSQVILTRMVFQNDIQVPLGGWRTWNAVGIATDPRPTHLQWLSSSRSILSSTDVFVGEDSADPTSDLEAG